LYASISHLALHSFPTRRSSDLKPLADRIEQLAHLQFQEKLGNYAEKTKRIEAITTSICMAIGAEKNDIITAARLCKADVVTEMRSEEHTSELQSRSDLVCRLLL